MAVAIIINEFMAQCLDNGTPSFPLFILLLNSRVLCIIWIHGHGKKAL